MSVPSPLRALLLAGGFGTRLGRLGEGTPKALLPLGGRPLADHLLDDLVDLPGLGEVVVVTNRKFAADLEAWARAARGRLKAPLRVLDDGTVRPEERLGAVGDLAFALKEMGAGGELLVLASDTLPGFPVLGFVEEFHRRPEADLLLAVREGEERLTSRGVAVLDEEERVVRFQEKPVEPASRLAALPLYLFRDRAIRRIPDYLHSGGSRDAPGHLVEWLVDRVRVEAWRAPPGPRVDVGTPEGYAEARRRFEEEGGS